MLAMLTRLGAGTASAPLSSRSFAAPASGRLNAPRTSRCPGARRTARWRRGHRGIAHLRHQVGALRSGPPGPAQVARRQPAAGAPLRGSVALRSLMPAAAAVAPPAERLLDEDLHALPDPFLGPLGHQLLGQAGEVADPPRDLVGGELARQGG